MKTLLLLLSLVYILMGGSYNSLESPHQKIALQDVFKNPVQYNTIIYQSEHLSIIQLSSGTYQHISFLETLDFGQVACNGIIVINNKEAAIFDTPTDEESSEELISFVQEKLNAKIKMLVPTHFHQDCVGGLGVFNEYHIPVWVSNRTLKFLKQNHNKNIKEIQTFSDSLILSLGQEEVLVYFLGEGHTKDNIVAYNAKDSILFGGCLIKERHASKGNLEDANIADWPGTVRNVREKFPNVKTVIPGHGHAGGKELLDYTEELFKD